MRSSKPANVSLRQSISDIYTKVLRVSRESNTVCNTVTPWTLRARHPEACDSAENRADRRPLFDWGDRHRPRP